MVVAYLKTTDWHTYTYVNKLSAHDSDFQWLDNINLLKSVCCRNFVNAVKTRKVFWFSVQTIPTAHNSTCKEHTVACTVSRC